MNSDYTRIKNLQNFGKSPNTNCLILTGISGSGKTTTARRMADHYRNVDVIHLDAYFGYMPESCRSKQFDKYLQHSYCPYEGFYDDFPEQLVLATLCYAHQIFPMKRVISEGAHWLDPIVENDSFIWPHIKGYNAPIVVCETSVAQACNRSENSDKVDHYWQRVWKSAIPRLLAD